MFSLSPIPYMLSLGIDVAWCLFGHWYFIAWMGILRVVSRHYYLRLRLHYLPLELAR